MPAPMSLDLRERIVAAVEQGSSIQEATRVRRSGMVAGLSTIHNALRRFGLPLRKSR
jgi:hypothetical protein